MDDFKRSTDQIRDKLRKILAQIAISTYNKYVQFYSTGLNIDLTNQTLYFTGKNMRSSLSVSKSLLLVAVILGCVTSCYRMPNDDEFSVVPLTNNPDFTRKGAQSPIPGASY